MSPTSPSEKLMPKLVWPESYDDPTPAPPPAIVPSTPTPPPVPEAMLSGDATDAWPEPPAPTPINPSRGIPLVDGPDPLRMPEEAMYGWLADRARAIDAPLPWAYFSLMTLFAGQGVNISDSVNDAMIRSTLYTVLLGPPSIGKSRAIENVQKSLFLVDDVVEDHVPGSDRAMQQFFPGVYEVWDLKQEGTPNSPPRVLVQDELLSLLDKINVPNSSLASTLCTLFYKDKAGSGDKSGKHTAHVRLSLLGAMALPSADDFPEHFSAKTMTGLYSRCIFIPCQLKRYTFHHETIHIAEKRFPQQVNVENYVFARQRAYIAEDPDNEHRARIAELALRVALISASANGDKVITPACLDAAFKFADWQLEVRKVYSPSPAKNEAAILTGLMLDTLKSYKTVKGDYAYVDFWPVARKKNWSRKFSAGMVNQVRYALIRNGEIEEQDDPDDGSTTSKKFKIAKIRVTGYTDEFLAARAASRKKAS